MGCTHQGKRLIMNKKELKAKINELKQRNRHLELNILSEREAYRKQIIRNQGQERNIRSLSKDFSDLLKENTALRAARADDLTHRKHLKKLFNDLEVSYNNKWHEYEVLLIAHNKLKISKFKEIIKCLT